MQNLGLVLCITNTQPPGTTGTEVRRSCERAYFPMLDLLDEFTALKVSMHWSGLLVEWMELHAPERLEQLYKLVHAGRIEILGGLHGGAVLPSLPERDAVGQVQVCLRWWRQHGDVRVRGAWLPYYGWDPVAPRIFGRLGVQFSVLEVSQLGSGANGDGYWLAEREGSILALFGADPVLSRMAPSASPQKVIEHLAARARAGNRVVTMVMRGEDFGAALESSSTRSFSGERAWVRRFFLALVEASPWLKLAHFGTVLDRLRPSGRIYPPASVQMSVAASALGGGPGAAWQTLLADVRRGTDPSLQRVAPFLRIPGWESTLASSPEVLRLHRRMLRTSREVARLRSLLRDDVGHRGDGEGLTEALEDATAALYRGQNGSAYVHGADVGAQLGDIRHHAWSNLVRAEYAVHTALGDADRLMVEQSDHDGDGRNEVIVRTPSLCAFVSPAQGGTLTELDSWTLPGNLLNVRTRVGEPHHDAVLRGDDLPQLIEESPEVTTLIIDDEDETDEVTVDETDRVMHFSGIDLASRLHYDRHVRGGFVDHFFGPETTLQNLRTGRYAEAGDFVGADYQLLAVHDDSASEVAVSLARDGNVVEGTALRLVRLVKRYVFPKDVPLVEVRYEIVNRYHEPVRTRFAVGIDINLDSSCGPDTFLETGNGRRIRLDEAGELDELTELSLVDMQRGFRFTLSPRQPARVWHFPIETISRSPRGVAPVFQGVALYFWWPMELWGQEKRRVEISASLEA
ncbi:alpha-amylase [Deltaproteobacteria bacterium]|nr:alpha-amylase [Deltaproteobacteria bacterium]